MPITQEDTMPPILKRNQHGDQPTVDAASDTPYRLPKIDLLDDFTNLKAGTGYRVWSRNGYDIYRNRPGSLAHLSRQVHLSPLQISREMRRASGLALSFPKFRCAAIQPHMPGQPKFYAGPPDPAFLRSGSKTQRAMEKVDDSSEVSLTQRARNTTAVAGLPRINSAQDSLHWMLSPYKNFTFDKKGSGRVQGPYSREFTVHCKAPMTWKKMIWGNKPGTPLVYCCRPPVSSTAAKTSHTAR